MHASTALLCTRQYHTTDNIFPSAHCARARTLASHPRSATSFSCRLTLFSALCFRIGTGSVLLRASSSSESCSLDTGSRCGWCDMCRQDSRAFHCSNDSQNRLCVGPGCEFRFHWSNMMILLARSWHQDLKKSSSLSGFLSAYPGCNANLPLCPTRRNIFYFWHAYKRLFLLCKINTCFFCRTIIFWPVECTVMAIFASSPASVTGGCTSSISTPVVLSTAQLPRYQGNSLNPSSSLSCACGFYHSRSFASKGSKQYARNWIGTGRN